MVNPLSETHGSQALKVCVIAAIVVVVPLLLVWKKIPWASQLQPLPLAMLVCLGISLKTAVDVRRTGANDRDASGISRRLSLIVFAGLLLTKMALNTRARHYGFAVAMPATLVAVTGLVAWVPRWLDRRGAAGCLFRAVALATIAVMIWAHLNITANAMALKVATLGHGSDEFRVDARGQLLQAVLTDLQTRIRHGQTLAVLPEGVMLNYLGRWENPTSYANFNPPDLAIFGEQKMVAAFEAHPPDYVLIVHKNTAEDFDLPFFGRDYGQSLYQWMLKNYQPAPDGLWGAEPLTGRSFGARLWERK